MATIKEIAEKSGVSIATVSNIINGKGKTSPETAARVRRVIEEMHYVPNAMARNLKTKKSRSIGVIVEDMTIFSIPDIVDGITDYCDHKNYQIFLVNLRLFKNYGDTYYDKDFYFDKVQQEILKLKNLQVEGIIYVAAHERILKAMPDTLDIPAVMAYSYTQSKNIPSVVVDDMDGMYQITKEVLKKGHRRIGLITGKKDSLHAKARLMGYQKALFLSGAPIEPALIQVGDWNRQSGYDLTSTLLKQKVTAIMCMNDLMAGGVYDRLEELHLRAGRDISVTGYDDRQLSAYYKPPLTTVGLPLHDIGYRASEILLGLLEKEARKEKKEEPLVVQVPCHLEKRKSVVQYAQS